MKEKVYDDQINPLMAQIIKICKKHKIAFIADFQLDDDLRCTSSDLRDSHQPNQKQLEAFDILKPSAPHFAFAETIETKPDGSQHITLRRIS